MPITLGDVVIFLRGNDSRLEGDLNSAEQKTRGWAGRLGGAVTGLVGGAVLAGATAAAGAVVGIGAAAFNTATAIDNATNLLQTKLGISEQSAQRFGEVLRTVYGDNFGESIEDVGDSLTTVIAAMDDWAYNMSNEELATVTEAALSLRDVFDIDVTESIRAAKVMVNNGLVPTFEDAFDTIVAGMQGGLNTSGDLIDTLTEYSDDFADLGLTADETLGLLRAGMEAGAFNTDKLADSLNEFGVNLRDPAIAESLGEIDRGLLGIYNNFQQGNVSEREALEGMLQRLQAIEDPIARDQAGVLLFRSMWEDLGETAVLSMGNIQSYMVSTADASDELLARQLPLGERLQGVWRRVQVALEPLGEKLVEIAEQAIPYVEQAAQWLADNMPGIINRVVETAGQIVTWVRETLIPRLQEFADWFAAELWPRILEVVTWLIAAFNDISTFVTTQLVPWLQQAFTDVQGGLQQFAGWFTVNLWPHIQTVLQWLITAFNDVAVFVSTELVPWLQQAFTDIASAIQSVVDWFNTNIMPVIRWIFDLISEIFNAFRAAFEGDWTAFGEHLRTAWDNLWNGIATILSDIGTALLEAVGNIINSIISFFTETDWIGVGRSIIEGIGNGITNFAGSVIDGVRNVASGVIDAFRGFLGIQSPSKVAAEQIGAPLAAGIAEGVMSAAGLVNEALAGAIQFPAPGQMAIAGASVGQPAVTNITVNFHGANAPATAAEAETSAGLLVSALRRKGVI